MDAPTIPIFLVGSERSGTTLLRLMLDHHPELAFNLESEFLVKHIADSGEFPDVVVSTVVGERSCISPQPVCDQ